MKNHNKTTDVKKYSNYLDLFTDAMEALNRAEGHILDRYDIGIIMSLIVQANWLGIVSGYKKILDMQKNPPNPGSSITGELTIPDSVEKMTDEYLPEQNMQD
jgi:hypothetical protein